MKNAENTHQLKIGSSLELLLYKVLKKIAKEKDVKIRKVDKDKDAITKDKVREYIIGDVTVEIVDGILIRVNAVETGVRGLEDGIIDVMVNK